ncbi:molybdopterin-binding oxidoreductase, partial [Halorubrum sp. E3]
MKREGDGGSAATVATDGAADRAVSGDGAGGSPASTTRPADDAGASGPPVSEGDVREVTIETLGEAGHLIHIALALAIAVGLFGAVAFAGLRIAPRTDRRAAGAAVAGGVSWLLAAALTGVSLSALGAALPAAAAVGIGWLPSSAAPSGGDSAGARDAPAVVDAVRRRTLGVVAGALGFVAATVVGRRAFASDADPLADAPRSEGAAARLQ